MRCCFLAVVVLCISACGVESDSASATNVAPSTTETFTQEDFDDYLRALRAHDYDGFTRHYAPGVRMNMAGGPALDRDGLVAMERGLADVWDWTMDIGQTVLDERGAAIRATMHGPFLKDVPELFGASPKAGERWRLDFTMFYTLRDGKIAELHPGPPEFARQP